MRALAVLASTATVFVITASTAVAATARLLIPRPSVLKSSDRGHVHFALPASWKQTRGAMKGTPAIGDYHRDLSFGNGVTCVVTIEVTGVALRARPTYARSVLRVPRLRFLALDRRRVGATGRHGDLRWYVGRPQPADRL
jgi:hypothetical protein